MKPSTQPTEQPAALGGVHAGQPVETKGPTQPGAALNVPRLQQQIKFLTEIDKLKQVLRRTWLLDQSRYENDAEHSWLREARHTPEARYAAAMDRFQPLLHNYLTGGRAWLDHAVTSDRVLVRNQPVGEGAPLLGQYAEDLIRDAVAKGYLAQ